VVVDSYQARSAPAGRGFGSFLKCRTSGQASLQLLFYTLKEASRYGTFYQYVCYSKSTFSTLWACCSYSLQWR